ncbi:hypothetical protein KSP39_PZI012917 [Platanthera zijinensis]|uniref:Uncharacterized protein n=1 Tax=Platanthera zijinensis TaxID=2320716 RepID=A0AAP0G327_9ASPA
MVTALAGNKADLEDKRKVALEASALILGEIILQILETLNPGISRSLPGADAVESYVTTLRPPNSSPSPRKTAGLLPLFRCPIRLLPSNPSPLHHRYRAAATSCPLPTAGRPALTFPHRRPPPYIALTSRRPQPPPPPQSANSPSWIHRCNTHKILDLSRSRVIAVRSVISTAHTFHFCPDPTPNSGSTFPRPGSTYTWSDPPFYCPFSPFTAKDSHRHRLHAAGSISDRRSTHPALQIFSASVQPSTL